MTYKLYSRLLSYVKPYWLILAVGLLSTAIAASVDAAATYVLQPLINQGFVAHDQHFIRLFPWLVFGAFFIRGITTFSSSFCMAWVARKVVMILRQSIFAHLQKIPARYYDNSSSGKLLSKLLYDVEQVAQTTAESATKFVNSFCMVVGLIIVMVSISWQLSAGFFLSAPIIIGIVKYTNRRIRNSSLQVQKSMGEVTEIAEESIEGYREVRIFGAEQREIAKFNAATNRARRGDMKVEIAQGINVSGVQIIASFAITLIVYYAINPESPALLSAGAFTSMMVAMLALLKPLKDLTKVLSEIQKGLTGARSVFEMLDTEVEHDQGSIEITRCRGDIHYQHVYFAYPQHDHLLQDIHLHIPAGKTVALVGRSGAGKTTLTSLLARFYDVTDGQITLDGQDIRDITRQSLRRQIALVSQQVTLFNGTVRENIAYGVATEISDEEIWQAAKAAHASEFIQQLPQQLDTIVGDNGVLLSGGQRQRIAIARAILKDAPILILDEATSALDTEAERHIQAALNTLMRNRTTLVIAHRLSTIENADLIAVMDAGRIIEMGSHQQLLQKEGAYHRLYQMQFSEEAVS